MREGPSDQDEAFIAEARAVYGRYAREFVESLRMCPWAERSRLDGHTAEHYLLDERLDDDAMEATLDRLRAIGDDENVEVGLILFPRLAVDRVEFDRFVSQVRERDVARHRPTRAPMALAPFHPDATPNTETAYRLVPFIRRSPDPLIQCVRVSLLDELRKGDRGTNYLDPQGKDLLALFRSLQEKKPPLHERVAEMNLESLREFGIAEAEALLDEILADRDARYARFGVPPRRGA